MLTEQEKRLWRALIRFVSIEKDYVYIVIPGWNSSVNIKLDKNKIPIEIQNQMKPDFRCHAYVNKGAENESDLIITNWEKE